MSWLLIAILAADLTAVRQEPNLERRSELALASAESALAEARTAYGAGDLEKTKALFGDVQASVDLMHASLTETGKDARRKPKFFKQAELGTKQLLRRLEGMRESMSYQDRALADAVRDNISEIHEALLTGIMGKKKR